MSLKSNQQNHIRKIRIEGISSESTLWKLRDAFAALPHVVSVDVNRHKRLLRIVSSVQLSSSTIAEIGHSWSVSCCEIPYDSTQHLKLSITGMTCHSCEVLIERKLKEIPAVSAVRVNAHKGTAHVTVHGAAPHLDEFQSALKGEKYGVSYIGASVPKEHPQIKTPYTYAQILGFIGIALVVSILLARFGLLKGGTAVSDSIHAGGAFLLGLVAATSSCVATVGGLLLSSLAQYRDASTSASNIRTSALPTFSFIAGRVLSYTVLGGVIAGLGAALAPSPLLTGAIVTVAALYMIAMGLSMLHCAPSWLLRFMPRMPKAFSHRIFAYGSQQSAWGPFFMGGATFFVPCGFTQALQLYVLTVDKPLTGAVIMGAFALGTTPALLALGFSFNAVRGKVQRFFFGFSGALVMLMGLTNIQNGLTIAGYPLPLDVFKPSAWASSSARPSLSDSNVTFDGKEQTVTMAVTELGYQPNRFVIRAGVPTKWVVDATRAGGCLTVLQAPQLGVRQVLKTGLNTIAFTPPQPGRYAFSCSMGMFRGQFDVVGS